MLLASLQTPKVEDHPLSAYLDCLFNILADTLHIWRRWHGPTPGFIWNNQLGAPCSWSKIDYFVYVFNIVPSTKNFSVFVLITTPNLLDSPLELWRRKQAGTSYLAGAASRRQLVCNITSISPSPLIYSPSYLLIRLLVFFLDHSRRVIQQQESWLSFFSW